MVHRTTASKSPSVESKAKLSEPMLTLRQSLKHTKLNTRYMRNMDQMASSNLSQLKRDNYAFIF
jgi:hypothetical protein